MHRRRPLVRHGHRRRAAGPRPTHRPLWRRTAALGPDPERTVDHPGRSAAGVAPQRLPAGHERLLPGPARPLHERASRRLRGRAGGAAAWSVRLRPQAQPAGTPGSAAPAGFCRPSRRGGERASGRQYRDLWGRPLPREMLYQLAIYALAQCGTNASATILYPSFAPRTRDQVVVFNDVMRGAPKARVILRPVNLPRVERLLRAGGSWRTHGSSRRAVSRQRGSWWVVSPRMSLAALARAPGRRACHYGCDTSTRNQRGSWVPKSCGCRSVCPR